jgi:hypothetical protein
VAPPAKLCLLYTTHMWGMLSACRRHFRLKHDPALKYIPLEVAARAPIVKINEMSYISAPLRPKCSGWHPEWGKAWESWGAPSYPVGG